jgi:hypothetical protein
MSIQFRSRVKSVKDFGSDLKQVGVCCYPNGTSVSSTFYECFSSNGTFLVGENIVCPDRGEIGNCFACTYLTPEQKIQVINNPDILQGNIIWGTSTVTECECTRVGGVFHPTVPTKPNGRDARIPQSCCYFAYNASGFPLGITCENVCSEKECSLKGITLNNGQLKNTPVYDGENTCLTSNCSTTNLTNFLYTQMAIGAASTTTDDVGACFVLSETTDGYSYDCDLTTRSTCVGYWISPDIEESDFVYCNSIYAPTVPSTISGRAIEPEIMSESSFNALGLTPGDEFHGGIYIGKFMPNSSSTKVYGSLNFTTPEVRHYNETSPRDSYRKWALIVEPNSYYTRYMKTSEVYSSIPQTSLSDGFYNCYGNRTDFYGLKTSLLNSIVGKIRKGFADYYIPSIVELQFLANAMRINPSLSDILEINSKLISSSFFFEDITTAKTNKYNFNGNIFLYSQELASSSNFGKLVLTPATGYSYLRFFRKVILT